MATGIERLVTSGKFELDGGSWDVDNNIWIVGDGSKTSSCSTPHTPLAPIVEAVAGRNVVAVVCTHGHNDHVTVAPELGKALDAPVLLHPADDVLWRMTHPDDEFRAVDDGLVLHAGEIELRALHTPGHSPGSVCWYAPELGAVFSGDTLFSGGPGATGRSYSDFPTILDSIKDRLGTLPGRRWSTPATVTPPPSATRSSTTTSGSSAAARARRAPASSRPRTRPLSARPNHVAGQGCSAVRAGCPGRWGPPGWAAAPTPAPWTPDA